ncbi:MAG: glycosyl hydrolase 53 family protein [Candidatus Omnitrophica bacterium]|nr:glycosyl hydrolase 53 family protein [Candidatus Omnitrophota bacterium]
MKKLIFLIVMFCLPLSISCAEAEVGVSPDSIAVPVGKGQRLLGVEINPANDGNYDQAFAKAREAGCEVVSLSINWDDFEKAPGKFGMEPNFLQIANQYYPSKKTKISLVIRPLDTNGRHFPKDLVGKSFSDPQVTSRFAAFLDYVFSQVKDVDIIGVSIGNEIDVPLAKNIGEWIEYGKFFYMAVVHIKQKYPHLKVGTTTTMYGITKQYVEEIKAVNSVADVIYVTYYPMSEDFFVKDPKIMTKEIGALVALYPKKLIYIGEIGYPSSPVLKSSLLKQQEFIRQSFLAWDRYAANISYMSFLWLHDPTVTQVQYFKKYYGISDKNFVAYLATLGLRQGEGAGTDKPAFDTFKQEAKARGW